MLFYRNSKTYLKYFIHDAGLWWPISLVQNHHFEFEYDFDIKFEIGFEIEFEFEFEI